MKSEIGLGFDLLKTLRLVFSNSSDHGSTLLNCMSVTHVYLRK